MLTIPYRRFAISSNRPPLAVARLLGERTQRQSRWFRWPTPEIRFIGKVSPEQLRLVPVVRGRNTYAPWILGDIKAVGPGCVIQGRMTLHPIAVAAVLALVLWSQYLAITREGAIDVVVLAAMVAFHVVMYFVAFLPEVRRAESFIRDLVA